MHAVDVCQNQEKVMDKKSSRDLSTYESAKHPILNMPYWLGMAQGISCEWIKNIPAQLERLSRPLTLEQESDRDEILPPTQDACLRTMKLLLLLAEKGTPEPEINGTRNRNLEISWDREDIGLYLTLIVQSNETALFARCNSFDNHPPWLGPVAENLDNTTSALNALRTPVSV